MKIKESIEFLNKIIIDRKSLVCSLREYNIRIDEVISLLTCGEKYRHMWEKFKDEYGFAHYVNQDCGEANTLKEFMNIIEQKYFPK